ncbi:MAG: hypothetical protein WKF85_13185 [Chitinophagaceae bacterium]
MQEIRWNHFNGKQFQKLCNSILLFEVSKFAHVFTAEGADSGIDQSFVGKYGDEIGKWRFQDKFHNSGKGSADIAALKRDITTDIKNNYKGEDFLVLFTNVNLTTKKYNELFVLGNQTIKETGNNNCTFFLWHEATIEGLIANHPLIFNWFWERDSVLLQTYHEYFQQQLKTNNDDLRYQLHNTFFGRETDLDVLDLFLKSSKSALAIIANGGYGKTRLCIEFFERTVSRQEDWLVLVLTHTGFNANHFARLLDTNRRLLF